MGFQTRSGGTVARAFALAPESTSLDELRQKLKREGYSQVDEHLSGAALRSDLKKLLG